jgi:hypothetical protein
MSEDKNKKNIIIIIIIHSFESILKNSFFYFIIKGVHFFHIKSSNRKDKQNTQIKSNWLNTTDKKIFIFIEKDACMQQQQQQQKKSTQTHACK